MNRIAKRLLIGIPAAIVIAILVAAIYFRVDKVLKVATGHVSHILCSETFITGLDPAVVFDETIRPFGAFKLVAGAVHWQVDRDKREVIATIFGGSTNRAVYRDGRGCTVIPEADTPLPQPLAPIAQLTPAVLPEIAGPALVEPKDERLRAILDRAFAEREGPPFRRTKAVVIAYRGRVVAERYAPGYGVDVPILGWSVSKSINSALIGILVRQGKLKLDEPAPIAAWSDPNDARHKITIEQLLRMDSGLALSEDNSGKDPTSLMLYTVSDMAKYAEAAHLDAEIGKRWQYSSGSTMLLARMMRDAAGGTPELVQHFAERELLGPLGIRHMVMEFDPAGTPVGSSYFFAPPRDWVRFGVLYANDGVIGGKRILPEGWAAMSAQPTLGGIYGAGFWTARADGNAQAQRMRGWGMPADAYFGQGFLGQFVVIVPSIQLVVARFGITDRPLRNDIEGVSNLVRDAAAILAPAK
jgi:CubicO group peptidase (beta-lactamase class C family)